MKAKCLESYDYVVFEVDNETGKWLNNYHCQECKRQCDRLYSNNPDVEQTLVGLCLTCAWRKTEEAKRSNQRSAMREVLIVAAIICAVIGLVIAKIIQLNW